jgi:hypothetical protein
MIGLITYTCVVSFIVGIFFGWGLRRQSGRSWSMVITAPVVAMPVIWSILYIDMLSFYLANPQQRNSNPVYLQAMGATGFVFPTMVIISIVPAMVGYLIGHAHWRGLLDRRNISD